MLAPDDDITIEKKEVIYDNLTYKKFENLVQKYKYFELGEALLLFGLILSNNISSFYIYDFLSFFQSSFENHFDLLMSLPPLNWFLITNIFLLLCAYQVYKSLDNLTDKFRLSIRFYIFQGFKIVVYLLPIVNLYFVFAIVALARIIIIHRYSRSKSFI